MECTCCSKTLLRKLTLYHTKHSKKRESNKGTFPENLQVNKPFITCFIWETKSFGIDSTQRETLNL